ncbi:uncharacterized protein DUF1127 [Dongia mobilis]|uniref:Uncharacterized protein DUF1127 n=1 Tax=Dongia mobilis TaxID=578943 RepID=A0A4R6WJE3_9PROT|nr:DUF1127 domain-containing protein [Dongia mobilis]TDQ80512.1 uncharacterized protein DUF1127 [Dongia mobilis]
MYPYKMLSAPYGLFRSITAAFAETAEAVVNSGLAMMERRRQRHALARLDEHLLKDIGLTACDVERETSRPFWR